MIRRYVCEVCGKKFRGVGLEECPFCGAERVVLRYDQRSVLRRLLDFEKDYWDSNVLCYVLSGVVALVVFLLYLLSLLAGI